MDKYQYFKSLHNAKSPLFLGNVHDVLSALMLENAGFKALGTTSWGVANSFGYTDGEQINFNDHLLLLTKIVDVVNIPVSVDIESGYSVDNKIIVNHVLKIADAGAVGVNIEDSVQSTCELRDINECCLLLSLLRTELDKRGYSDFYINARTDSYLLPISNRLEETLRRGKSYSEHGADGFFVPGMTDEKEIMKVSQIIPLPLNIMALPELTQLKVAKQLKIARFSFGNALSDKIIAYMERLVKDLCSSQDTALLYAHDPIKLEFKGK